MDSLFSDPSKRIYALYGNTGDYFCTPQLRELDLAAWLLGHLQTLGYQRIIYYSPNKKIHFMDAESARLARPGPASPSRQGPSATPAATRRIPPGLKPGPLGFARISRGQAAAAPPPQPEDNADIRWDFGAMSDAQAISGLDRILCEPIPTALVFQNGEDLFAMLDQDAVRHWDNTLGDWVGARLPSSSINLAVLVFRDEISIQQERLPRLRKHLFGEGQAQPMSDRAFRVGPARQDEVASLLHRLRLLGAIRWTPFQIQKSSLGLAQGLIPGSLTAGVKSLGTVGHQVRSQNQPLAAEENPWRQLQQAPGLASRVEHRLRNLVLDARTKLARHGPPPQSVGPHDIERLSIRRQPAPDKLANLHLALLGSPGTGKTTLARLVARIYRDEGILTSGHLVEVTASNLIEDHVGGTAKRTAEAISRALGGILFIDEAYSLGTNRFGPEAVAELVQAMSAHNGQFAVIIAGYTKEINDFIDAPDANAGLRSRFPEANRWTLGNYTPTELNQIFSFMLTQEDCTQDESLRDALPLAFAQWHLAQDPERFGNAREVKNLVTELTRRAGDRRLIQKADFAELPGWRQYLGLHPLPTIEALLRPLDHLIGIETVRDQLEKPLHRLQMAMRRDGTLAGHPPGHYLLIGNAGTGKTEVARLLGPMLHQLGLLNKGHLQELLAHQFVGDASGDAENRMRDALRRAQDGVLFIDEAHQWVDDNNPQGRSALRVLVPEMENRRQQLCVILAGYPENMRRLLATDQGLQSRMIPIYFSDYEAPTLHRIAVGMLAAKKMRLSPAASERLLRLLGYLYAHRQPDFGNARDVRKLIEEEILSAQSSRLAKDIGIPNGDPRLFVIEVQDIPTRPGFDPRQWDDVVSGRGGSDINHVLQRLEGLVGLAPVKTAIRQLADTLAVQQRRGKGMVEAGHYVFSGNPGTGKTTVARIMGEIFRTLGLLAKGHVVEVRREDLVGRFQGDAETNMRQRIEEAMDGILFIDEAYQLVADEHDIYGRRALETLLASMENHRHRLTVILAGYPVEMGRLLSANPGFKGGRVKDENIIGFPDYDAAELLQIALGLFAAQDYRLTSEAKNALSTHLMAWDSLRGRRDFGNARKVRNLVDEIIMRQATRIRPRLDQVTDQERDTLLPEDIPAPPAAANEVGH